MRRFHGLAGLLLAALLIAGPALAALPQTRTEGAPLLLFADTSASPGADTSAPALSEYVKTDTFPLTITARRFTYLHRAGEAMVELHLHVRNEGEARGWIRLAVGDQVAAAMIPPEYDGAWKLQVRVDGLAEEAYEGTLDMGWPPYGVGERLTVTRLTAWVWGATP